MVTVVPVATMVMGAGVIVVVLSTVTGGRSAFCTPALDQIWERNLLYAVWVTGTVVKLDVTELQ